MKATFKTIDLQNAVRFVSKAVMTKGIRPVLSGIKFHFAKGQAVLTACNMDLYMSEAAACEHNADADVILSGAKLMAVCNVLRGDTVSIAIDDSTAKIVYDGGRHTIPVIDCDGFPDFPQGNAETCYSLEPSQLANAIESVRTSAANDQSGYSLQGIYFDFGNKSLVATDTHRLTVCELPMDNDGMADIPGAIVPAKNALALGAFVDAGCNEVLLSVEKNMLVCECGHTRIASCTIEGQFPRYKEVIPAYDGTIRIECDTKPMIAMIQTAGISANEVTNAVKLKSGDDGCEWSAFDQGSGESAVEADCVTCGEIAIAFNYRYLIDGLKACGDKAVMMFKDANSPCIITNGENVKAVVSPIYPKNQ